MALFLTPPSTAASVPSATTTQAGTVRLATIAEAGGNSEAIAVTPAGLQAEIAGISGISGVNYRGTVAVADIANDLATASLGDMYKVSTSGTAHGYTWSIGDTIIVNTDMGGTFDVSKINRLDTTDSDLATVATTGDYNDLSNLPTIPSASTDLSDTNTLVRTTDLATVATSGSYNDLSGKPSIPSASTDLSDSADLVRTGDLGTYLTDITGEDLGDLSDVTITTPSNGDALIYSNGSWVNDTPQSRLPIQGTTGTSITANLNHAVYLQTSSLNTATVTLPLVANATDGDVVVIVRENPGTLIIAQQEATGTNVKYLDSGSASQHSITNNQQQLVVRFFGAVSQWWIFEKAQSAVAFSGDYNDLSNLPSVPSASTDLTDSGDLVRDGDNISLLNNDSAFISNITSESLNDLSDVSFTAGAPINNYVLTYNHSNTRWEAVAQASGGLAEVVEDDTPQLGGPLDVNGNAITSASNGNISINPDGTGDISIGADLIPDADATHTIGDESNRYISYYGDMNGAIRFKAKNSETSAITAGQVLYISGLDANGTTPTVGLADASDSSKMPAFGLALTGANSNAEVQVVSFGNLGGLNTSGFGVGDTLYVSATTPGGLENTKPTGEANLLQNIGKVVRSDNGAGIIKVGGAGRSAATPNLNNGNIFIGNSSNESTTTSLASVAVTSFNGSAGALTIGAENLNANHIAQNYTASDVNIDDHLAGIDAEFGALGTASTSAATDFLQVSNNLSDLNNPTTARTNLGLGTAATSASTDFLASNASLGDLSDVTITGAGSGEYVRYSGSAWVDASLELSDDTSPQLGGDLDTNQHEIVTASNRNLILRPNGTGKVQLGGNTNPAEIRLNCDTNDSHYVGLKSPTHSEMGTNPSVTYRLPITDASTAGDALVSDGSGNLSFTTIGGGASVLNDLTDVSISTLQTNHVLQYNGSNWTNEPPFCFLDYSYTTSNTNVLSNRGYFVDANNLTLTLPSVSSSTLREGDTIAVTTSSLRNVTIARNGSDTGNVLFYVGSASYAASHTLAIEKQEILIRFNGAVFYIVSRPLISALEDDTSPSLTANLDVKDQAITSSTTTGAVTLMPTGTGAVSLLNTSQNPEIRFYESTNFTNYVALKAPNTSTDVTFTLPSADATNAGDALVSDGSGNLSFTTISGGGGYTYATANGNTNAQANYHYSCTTTMTLTLPTSGISAGEEIRVKNMGTDTITISRNGLTIDGLNSDYTLDVQYSSVTFVYTGSGYEVV